jgi:aminoglycoside phosphotransferase (APT) family kinase protein
VSIADLVRLDPLGPALAEAAGDGRWRSLDATLIAGGKSNLTFEVTSEAGAVILRRPPSGELLPSAHDMGREARIQPRPRDPEDAEGGLSRIGED